MAVIKLHNTLGNTTEEFKPISKGEVKIYSCGPTVYNFVHIGNLRSNIFADTLRRMFEYNGFKVDHVVNITDIGHLKSDGDEGEDKMTLALKRENKPLNLEALKEVADFYTNAFLENLKELNIKIPTILPKASENVDVDLNLIKKLNEKGLIYKTSDGLYFETSKFSGYGKLGGLNLNNAEEKSRIGINTEKKNPEDFAVWKFNDELGFESEWGKGFPGWHIECSGMAEKYLGETIDVHTGGIDHIPVHHNNEIAQSEAAHEKPLAHYWLHNAFINISGEKISKSLGNDVYLKDIIEKGINPLAYRLLLLGAHYKTPMNFTDDALGGANTSLLKLVSQLSQIPKGGKINSDYQQKFLEYINDDLNTPKGLALVFELLKDSNVEDEDKKATILDFDLVLGLDLERQINEFNEKLNVEVPEKIKRILDEREIARKNKDFNKSDEIRKAILDAGYDIKDTENGPQISKI